MFFNRSFVPVGVPTEFPSFGNATRIRATGNRLAVFTLEASQREVALAILVALISTPFQFLLGAVVVPPAHLLGAAKVGIVAACIFNVRL